MADRTRVYRQEDFDNPQGVCDVVMKGGITSGVVYPLTVVELARRYRFSSIGGTSAGAVAAAVTAAAEYGRSSGGFQRIARLPEELGADLLKLFQPAPALRPVFDTFLATLRHKSTPAKLAAALAALLRGYPLVSLASAAPGLALIVYGLWHEQWIGRTWGFLGWALAGVLLLIVGLASGLALRLKRALSRDLAEHEFGLCPGIRQEGHDGKGFTDWLADVIDEAAGVRGEPLTFGHLAGGRHPIELAMMTTNLMMRRPHRLPFREDRRSPDHPHGIFLFRPSDFRRLFPQRICAYLLKNSDPFVSRTAATADEVARHLSESAATEGDVADAAMEPGTHDEAEAAQTDGESEAEFYYFPPAEKLPVIVAARMSLSFPLLISAVPLYARDFTLRAPHEQQVPRRCLFSDGGLSSNFPIHFFDRLWPNAPTFAVALDDYAEGRHGTERVWMPESGRGGWLLPIDAIDSLAGFLARLVYTAKDWQDNLQSTLPGYRERIVHVALKPDEGGLNITMPKEVIDRLVDYGAEAGDLLETSFDFDDHRWIRFLIAMARMEQTLDELADAYDGLPSTPEPFGAFLARFPPHAMHFKQSKGRLAEMLRRAEELAKLGRAWRNPPTIRTGNIPRPDTDLRITPKP